MSTASRLSGAVYTTSFSTKKRKTLMRIEHFVRKAFCAFWPKKCRFLKMILLLSLCEVQKHKFVKMVTLCTCISSHVHMFFYTKWSRQLLAWIIKTICSTSLSRKRALTQHSETISLTACTNSKMSCLSILTAVYQFKNSFFFSFFFFTAMLKKTCKW